MSAGGRGTQGFPPAHPPSGSLPSGRHGLSPEYVSAHQRARLVRAVGEVCAQRGYAEVTNADIARAAGVSPRTFYRHFASKEDCFLHAFAGSVRELEATVEAALAATGGPWQAQAGAALRALLEELGAHPSLARTLFVDVLFAGPAALRMREQSLDRCRASLPVPPRAPPEVAEAALGGVVEIIYHTVLAGRARELAGMGDELLYCLLVPLIGHGPAMEALQN